MTLRTLADFAPPQKPRLTATDLQRLVRADPRNGMQQGALLALRRRYALTDAQCRLIDTLARVTPHPKETLRRTAPALGLHPIPLPPERRDGLGVADVAWFERLPRDPAQINDDDAKELVRMESQAKTHAERRLVASVLEPIRQMRRREAERASLEQERALVHTGELLGNPYVRDIVADAFAEMRRQEIEGITDAEAMAWGCEQARLAQVEVQRQAARTLADTEARLAELDAEEQAARQRVPA